MLAVVTRAYAIRPKPISPHGQAARAASRGFPLGSPLADFDTGTRRKVPRPQRSFVPSVRARIGEAGRPYSVVELSAARQSGVRRRAARGSARPVLFDRLGPCFGSGVTAIILIPGLRAIRVHCPATRRKSGGEHVPYWTLHDAVEPARRRVSKPAGLAGAHLVPTNKSTA